jgi:galactokinase/mevalonate kinase-like predicted kinase
VHFRYDILSNFQDENGGTYTLNMTGVTHSSTELYKTQQKKYKQNKRKQHSAFCCLSFD